MLTIGSLFAGVGGLELGLERAGLGPVLWQVEKLPYRRRILARHWPRADRSVCDVRNLRQGNLPTVDVVCGGFPCVDISPAGSRTGLAGRSSGPLWLEFLRIITEFRPTFAVVENSSGLLTRGLEQIVVALQDGGYNCIWFPMSAHDLGLTHGRPRTWIVAYTDAPGLDAVETPRVHAARPRGDHVDRRRGGLHVPRPTDATGWRAFRDAGGPEPGVRRGPHGFSDRLDRRRLAALGDAVAPACAEVVGHIVRRLHETRKQP